jgi:hypothetical protein
MGAGVARTILFAAMTLSGVSATFGDEGGWKFELDSREQPVLSFSRNRKEIFLVGCGRAFGVHAIYPGEPRRSGKATIILATSRTKMRFDGEIEEGYDDGLVHFVQWDLGIDRRRPDAFGKPFLKRKAQLFDLLSQRLPLTITAEGRSYGLPAVNAPEWRIRFEQYC